LRERAEEIGREEGERGEQERKKESERL